jgi:hypothetical protein
MRIVPQGQNRCAADPAVSFLHRYLRLGMADHGSSDDGFDCFRG